MNKKKERPWIEYEAWDRALAVWAGSENSGKYTNLDPKQTEKIKYDQN